MSFAVLFPGPQLLLTGFAPLFTPLLIGSKGLNSESSLRRSTRTIAILGSVLGISMRWVLFGKNKEASLVTV